MALLILWLPRRAAANPIVFDPFGGFGIGYLIALPCLALEFLLLWIMLRRQGLGSWRLAKTFLRVHLVSFPVTLLLSGFVAFFAEAFPLLYEPWRFSKSKTLGGLDRRRLFAMVISANLGSFIAGIIATQVLD